MFTGGERVPVARAREFEERTGCAVLQFYGSNEAGPLSVTTVDDPRTARLTTAGRPVPARGCACCPTAPTSPPPADRARSPRTAPAARPATSTTTPPTPPCSARTAGCSPATWPPSTPPATWPSPAGSRTSSSAAATTCSALVVEEAVGGHPVVAQAAVVAVPDPILGERVCAYVVTRATLTLDALRVHLDATGVSKQNWPEYLVTLPSLPLGTGGKVDKAALRADAAAPLPPPETRIPWRHGRRCDLPGAGGGGMEVDPRPGAPRRRRAVAAGAVTDDEPRPGEAPGLLLRRHRGPRTGPRRDRACTGP